MLQTSKKSSHLRRFQMKNCTALRYIIFYQSMKCHDCAWPTGVVKFKHSKLINHSTHSALLIRSITQSHVRTRILNQIHLTGKLANEASMGTTSVEHRCVEYISWETDQELRNIMSEYFSCRTSYDQSMQVAMLQRYLAQPSDSSRFIPH